MELTIKHLSFGYIKRPLSVVDFSCALKNGEIISIAGGEFAGKTSLLRVISGIEKQYAGSIMMNKTDANFIALESRNISFIPSEPVFLQNKTIFENLKFLGSIIGQNFTKEYLCQTLQKFGLDIDLNLKMKKLSSAQKKVFTLVRSFLKNPDLLLLDDLFKSENQEEAELITNAIETYFANKNKSTSVIYIENAKNQIGKGSQTYYLSFGKSTKLQKLEDLKTNPIDLFAGEYLDFVKKDYDLMFDGYNYYLMDNEVLQVKKTKTINTLRQIKLSEDFFKRLEIQNILQGQKISVQLLSEFDFSNLSDSDINRDIKQQKIFVFDKNTFTKVL